MAGGETTTVEEGAAPAAPSSPPKGTGLELRNLTKVFDGGVVAVDDFNLHIPHGEYVVLLGPSGCGKTTTLRMIGGHETVTSGEILLDGEPIHHIPPDKRPTTTVFQHFALFPHKSVIDNVEFGLKMHGVEKEERRQKALEALEMVGLRALAERKPKALSGGQQQRVSLARVLVTSPKALLLDEPLGDVDRLLQLRMRVELRNLQRQLGLMFIHVTHNQEEALAVSDRIVVMWDAKIQQVGDPWTISTKPRNELVASFMGDNNIVHGRIVERHDDHLTIEDEHGLRWTVNAHGDPRGVGDRAAVAVRAAAVHVAADSGGAPAENTREAQITFIEYLGDIVKLHLVAKGERLLAKIPSDTYLSLRGREGDTIRLWWKEEDVQLLEP